MRKLATAICVLAISAVASGVPASAAEHVNSLELTGAQVKHIVEEQGSVILDTGPDLYDRYVANASYCAMGELAQRAYVPTADSSSNFVGYTCHVDLDNG